MGTTPTHQLADALLGDAGPLRTFVESKRSQGRSWRLIARDLLDATDGKVDVTAESLRKWFPESVCAAS